MAAATLIRTFLLTVALLALFPVQGAADEGAEIGFDLGLAFMFYDNSSFGIAFGTPAQDMAALLQNARIGWYVNDRGQIETSFGLAMLSGDFDTFYQAGLGLDWVQTIGSGRSRPFLRVGGLGTLVHLESTQEQFGIGAGFGVRSPIGDRLALRTEASLNQHFGSDQRPAHTDVLLNLGVSFFTR